MAQTALVVLTTLANEADARALVTTLVTARLVACGTLLPGARSIYRWEGQMKEEAEVVVLLKTDGSKWEALCAAVRERHPYQVPAAPAPGRDAAPARRRTTPPTSTRPSSTGPPLRPPPSSVPPSGRSSGRPGGVSRKLPGAL